MREEVVHVDQSENAEDKRGNLPHIKRHEKNPEYEGESGETKRWNKHGDDEHDCNAKLTAIHIGRLQRPPASWIYRAVFESNRHIPIKTSKIR